MRIDPNAVVPSTLESTPPLRRRAAATPGASVVKLSSAGAALTAEPAPSPTTTSRLERIRAMLDAGEYPIDLDQLASRIVDDDLLRAGSKP